MKKYRLEIIIFIVDAICMILELVASRVLSPYFGSSNLVWTSVIGIILLSSSIGNYLGGIIADKKNVNNNLKIILAISAISIFIIPIYQTNIISIITRTTTNIKIGAIFSTLFLFFIPSLFIGAVTPIILKLKINDLDSAGKTTGKITAISTIGGIIGTFLGGFLLIPNFGSIQILFVLSILILLLIPIVDFKINWESGIAIGICILILIVFIKYSIDSNKIYSEQVLEGSNKNAVSYDTQYGRVLIYNGTLNGEPVRILNIDSGYESATFINEDKCNELVFDYTKKYDIMFKSNIEIKDTLLIGGAGYSYPKYFISHFENKNIDVVEIDGKITEIAKKYFFLDKLIKDYNLEQNHRLNLITEDGRTYLNNNSKKYDAIMNDAFSGSSPAKTLTTVEAVQNIKKSLNENGLYLTNIISSLEGKNSKFIKAEIKTLKQVFKNVYVVPCNDLNDVDLVQNNMVIATDDILNIEDTYEINLSDEDIVITDDYCPVDTLIPEE